MEANVSSIKGLIQNGRLLRIPYFQRSYVWGENDWERFAMDMESTFYGQQDYFLGAVILKEEAAQEDDGRNGIEKRCMVVDGQQRLTTLSIYMKVLYTLASEQAVFNFQYLRDNGTKDPVIEHSREDRNMFGDVMHMEYPQPMDNQHGSNVINAYNYFLNRLLPRKNDRTYLRGLINTINAHIRFVVITLTNTDDEQQIFDTINSLGVPLTTCDLVKNFLYGPDDEQAYNDSWRVVFEGSNDVRKFWDTDTSKSRQEKNKDNSTIERFFHAFVRIKMWDFKDELTETQRKDFVKLSNVFSTCKAFVEKFDTNVPERDRKQKLANEIIEYAKLFKNYLGEEILDEDNLPKFGCIKRISCFINATKQYSVIPYVLYILHEVNDENERNRIFTYLESYLVRRILSESNNNSYSDLFTENLIGNCVKDVGTLCNYISQRDDSDLAMPSDGRIKLNMSSRTKSLRLEQAQVVLYLYDTKSNRENKQFKSFNDFYIQMLMPKVKNANTDNWPQHRTDTLKEKERIMLMTTIGNYFMLEKAGEKPLKKLADASCSVKVDEMRKFFDLEIIRSNQALMIDGTDRSRSVWDESSIKVRNSGLAKVFCQVWAL